MGYERKGRVYPIHEILPLIAENATRRILLDGDIVKIQSIRLQVFLLWGTKCVSCGMEGQYFVKERRGAESFHLNLYGWKAVRGGRMEVLMTRDHILARSKGGGNELHNQQPMCYPCNNRKGDG